MKYIVASIGRSGSTLVTKLICEAMGLPFAFTTNLNTPDDGILKTHLHFKLEPDFDYKTIFIYSKNIIDVISSMYAGRLDITRHLYHLEVFRRHRFIFMLATQIRRLFRNERINEALNTLVFRYMIKNDKFRFKENALSWKASKRVLFVAYEDLCASKDKELLRMSTFLGITLPDFEIKERLAKTDNTPIELIDLAMREYDDFFQTLANR